MLCGNCHYRMVESCKLRIRDRMLCTCKFSSVMSSWGFGATYAARLFWYSILQNKLQYGALFLVNSPQQRHSLNVSSRSFLCQVSILDGRWYVRSLIIQTRPMPARLLFQTSPVLYLLPPEPFVLALGVRVPATLAQSEFYAAHKLDDVARYRLRSLHL